MKLITLLSLVFVSMVFGATVPKQPWSIKISDVLYKVIQNKSTISALIFLKDQPNLSKYWTINNLNKRKMALYSELVKIALSSQKELLRFLTEKNIKFKSFYIVNAVAVYNITKEELYEIASRSDVARISSNESIRLLPKYFIDRRWLPKVEGVEPNIMETGADRVWNEFKVEGEGIVVASADTGVDFNHPALITHYRGYDPEKINHDYNWHDAIKEAITGGSSCGYNKSEPCDDTGHGTHTTGTMVGDDGKGARIGMAPKAKWIACRNMDNGEGRPSTYIDCFEWFFAPYPFGGDSKKDGKPELAPHIINNSWGCPESEECKDAEILPVLQVLKAAGIMVVASAGNEGPSCNTIQDPPAMHSEYTLSVGAYSHSSGKLAFFSSRGPSTYDGGLGHDVTAPGVGVNSSIPGNGYGKYSGTSMAGPHVAGQIALFWSYKPEFIGKIDETIELVRKSSIGQTIEEKCGDVEGSSIPNNSWGWGKINVMNLLSQ